MKDKANFIFFDIDGTLIFHDKNKEVFPESAIKAIRETRAKGNYAIIATGRPLFLLNHDFYNEFDGIIYSNGLCAKLGEEVIFERFIDEDKLIKFCSIFDKCNLGYILSNSKTCYIKNLTKMQESLIDKNRFKINPIVINANKMNINSIDIFYKNYSELVEVMELLKEELIFNPHNDELNSVDIASVNWNKSNGIKEILERFKEKVIKSYAFGDGYNDIPMICNVDYGIAMGNAIIELKERAFYTTTDILEDGILNGLKNFNLL